MCGSKTGHALIGARQWIPPSHIEDPVKSLVMGLPLDLVFRTKGQLAIDICTDAFADGIRFDFICGDEVYGNCTELRDFFEDRGQAIRAAGPLELPSHAGRSGSLVTCAQAASWLLQGHAPLGGPLRREGFQRRPLVCLGIASNRRRRGTAC